MHEVRFLYLIKLQDLGLLPSARMVLFLLKYMQERDMGLDIKRNQIQSVAKSAACTSP